MSDPQAKLTPEELLQSAVGLTGTVERLAAENVRLRAELRQCQTELVEAANVLRPTLPSLASIYATAAERTRAIINDPQ